MLAALTHHLLGVHPRRPVADYLLTNTAVDLEAARPASPASWRTTPAVSPLHDAVVAFLGVEPVYLETALPEIADRHGSLDAYLEQALGVDAALRDRIGERLSA
jgi:protein-tyrosine phosphatase